MELEGLLVELTRDSRRGVHRLVERECRRREREAAKRAAREEIYRLERELRASGFTVVAGVDEAGRGALAGPLVAAAAVLPPDCVLEVRDSKELSAAQREGLFTALVEVAEAWSVVRVEPEEIDRIGVGPANLEAMRRAVGGLGVVPEYMLTDALSFEYAACPTLGLIKGDKVSASVAAASILAKVSRDRLMGELHGLYLDYGFDVNKGYGTAAHLEALRRLGPSPIHRTSFHWE